MKQECPTYLKSTRKSKALVATLSDTEPNTKSDDNDDVGILSASLLKLILLKGEHKL